MKVGYVGFTGHRHHKIHILKEVGAETPGSYEEFPPPEKEHEYAIALCGADSRKNGCKALVWNEDPKEELVFCRACLKKFREGKK